MKKPTRTIRTFTYSVQEIANILLAHTHDVHLSEYAEVDGSVRYGVSCGNIFAIVQVLEARRKARKGRRRSRP